MKYSLAFDQGEEYPLDMRYVIIPLALIDPVLNSNDNFDALCSFTMQFENENELKKAILNILPEFKLYRSCSLVLLKGKENLGEIVPYKQMHTYFNLEVLERAIIRKINNPEFRNLLLAPYSQIKYFAVVSNNLRRAGELYLDYNYLRKCVHAFLIKVCMNGDTIDYRQVYKIAVFIMNDLGLFNNELIEEPMDEELEEDSDSPKEFRRQWLIRRARLRQLGLW